MQGRDRSGSSNWIHFLARGGSANQIHNPASLYSLCESNSIISTTELFVRQVHQWAEQLRAILALDGLHRVPPVDQPDLGAQVRRVPRHSPTRPHGGSLHDWAGLSRVSGSHFRLWSSFSTKVAFALLTQLPTEWWLNWDLIALEPNNGKVSGRVGKP